jgi:hypothetical protein
MERVDRASLNNALITTGAPLQRRLPSEAFEALGALMEEMMRRWPAQDLESSMDVFTADMESLTMLYGIERVRSAVMALRISPDQKFYPRPDDVAREIEDAIERNRSALAAQRQAREWRVKVAEFWKWAPQWMEDTGNDEEELLRRHPSYRGTKPKKESVA